jgi:hypothetical protein
MLRKNLYTGGAPNAEAIGWRIGCQAYSFNASPFLKQLINLLLSVSIILKPILSRNYLKKREILNSTIIFLPNSTEGKRKVTSR